MTKPLMSIEDHQGIALLRMMKPPANAIDHEFAVHFEAALDEILAANPPAIIVTGQGAFFSGGLDLKAVPTYSARQQQDFLKVVNRMIGKLYACPVPLVGAINGHAVAGAFIVVLATDYRVGPRGKFAFGLTEARAGIPFPAAPMEVLRAELSPPHVRYTALYAKNFGPQEALHRGVFDELAEPHSLEARALEVAADLATIPADAYARIKHQIRGKTIDAIAEINDTQSDPMLQNWLAREVETASTGLLKGH